MDFLRYLTIDLFAVWCLSEIVIGLISLKNRSKILSYRADRFSYFAVSLTTLLTVWLAILPWENHFFPKGFGSLSARFPLSSWLSCLFIFFGITIRLLAVATLKKQFTTTVAIVEKHEIVDIGIYSKLRHPAYLGHLMSLLGMGLASMSGLSLLTCVVLTLPAVLYRIHVEEEALLSHFGRAYGEYASQTKRLLPGVW